MASNIERMLLPAVCLAALFTAGALAPASGVHARQPAAPKQIEAHALVAAPESRAEAAQSIDRRCRSLIVAISAQFGTRQVQVKLDSLETEPVNLIDLHVGEKAACVSETTKSGCQCASRLCTTAWPPASPSPG